MARTLKQKIEILFGRYAANPLARFARRFVRTPLLGEIETIGRKTGQRRRVPVSFGIVGDQAWVIGQHGRASGWVNNLEANPKVRLHAGAQWLSGQARLLPDDDVLARGRAIARANKSPEWLGALTVRTLGTTPITVQIDLDGA